MILDFEEMGNWNEIEDGLRDPHLADFEADKAVKEQFPEFFTSKLGCELKLWTSFRRSFLDLELNLQIQHDQQRLPRLDRRDAPWRPRIEILRSLGYEVYRFGGFELMEKNARDSRAVLEPAHEEKLMSTGLPQREKRLASVDLWRAGPAGPPVGLYSCEPARLRQRLRRGAYFPPYVQEPRFIRFDRLVHLRAV